MTFLEALAIALLSAGVAFLTTLGVRWWDRRKVEWIVTGEAHNDASTKDTERPRVHIHLQLHNVGDGDAYDVRIRRCNGGDYEPWTTFDAPVIKSGDSIDVQFLTGVADWETAWMEVTARSSPVARSRAKTYPRVVLRDVSGPRTAYKPDSREAQGRGRRLPPEQGRARP